MRKLVMFASVLALVVTVVSCTSQPASKPSGESYFVVDESISLGKIGITLAGMAYVAPAEWTALGPSGMRKADYYYGPVEGDTDSASMAVYFFGTGQGGDVQANLDRWVSQVIQPDSSSSAEIAIGSQIVVAEMTVHIVEVTGTYTAAGMGMGGGPETAGYRLTGVVVEAPDGNVFFKLTGPEKTAAKMTRALATMIATIEKT